MRRPATFLLVLFLGFPVQAALRTWTGAVSNLWSNPANWDTGVPAANDDVRFDGAPAYRNTLNDLPSGLTLHSITSATGFSVGGNALTLTAGINAAGGFAISTPLTLAASQLFFGTCCGTFTVGGPVNLNGYTLTTQTTGTGGLRTTIVFSNTISGAGAIEANGPVWFTGHNSYSGNTTANNLTVFTDDGLGVADGTVGNGTVAKNLILSDANIGNEFVTLTGQLTGTGISSLAGPITSSTGGFLHVTASSRLTLTGRISATGLIRMTGDSGGVLVLTNPTNAFNTVTMSGSTVRLGATNALNVADLVTLTGATLDMNNSGATVGRFHIDPSPQSTFAAGALPLVVTSAEAPAIAGALTLTNGFVPAAASYVIIDNRSAQPMNGQFDGLPEGSSFSFHGTTYTITYHGGDGNDTVLLVSGSPLPATTTTLSSSRNPANQGDAVVFTAAVSSGSGTPAGTVTFRDGGADLGTVALNNGQARLSTSTLSPGSHGITAIYSPTSAHAPSSSATLTQTIVASPLQVSITDYTLVEGDNATTPAVFVVTLSRTATSTVVIDYSTEEATARAGSDYLAISGSLVFAPGEGRKTLVVEVIGDTLAENDETFNVRINSSTPGVTFTKALAVATIRNDDVSEGTKYEYARIGTRSLTLELNMPAGPGPFPVILWIPGSDPSANPALREVGRGYAVARVDYRSSTEAKFPAQIADIKGAVRWLRVHAEELHLDPLRIGAWGEDSGAWFASLLGTAPQAFDDPAHGNAGVSSRISAVLDWGGQTDLNALKADATAAGCSTDPTSPNSPESQFLGCAIPTCPSTASTASPMSWVSSSDAAFFIVHGTADCQVPSGQATRFASTLQAAGADIRSNVIPGVAAPGHDTYWTSEVALGDADAFFDAKLKGLEVPAIRRSSRH